MSGKRMKKLTTKQRLKKKRKKDPVFQLRAACAALEEWKPKNVLFELFLGG